MTDSIISRATMQQRGAKAFASKQGRNSHGMNPWAPALYDWLQGYDKAADEFYHGPSAGKRVDVAQPC